MPFFTFRRVWPFTLWYLVYIGFNLLLTPYIRSSRHTLPTLHTQPFTSLTIWLISPRNRPRNRPRSVRLGFVFNKKRPKPTDVSVKNIKTDRGHFHIRFTTLGLTDYVRVQKFKIHLGLKTCLNALSWEGSALTALSSRIGLYGVMVWYPISSLLVEEALFPRRRGTIARLLRVHLSGAFGATNNTYTLWVNE